MEETSNGYKVLRLLKQVSSSLRQNMADRFKEMNMTAPQGMLVGILAHHGKMKVSDLGEKLGLSNSTVSGIIDRLEKQGLVERIRSDEDRRVVYVDVTRAFIKKHREHFDGMERILEDIINNAAPEELEAVLKGLETLSRMIDRWKQQS